MTVKLIGLGIMASGFVILGLILSSRRWLNEPSETLKDPEDVTIVHRTEDSVQTSSVPAYLDALFPTKEKRDRYFGVVIVLAILVVLISSSSVCNVNEHPFKLATMYRE